MSNQELVPNKRPLNPEGRPKMSVTEWLGMPVEEVDPIITQPDPPAKKEEPHIHTPSGDGGAGEGLENQGSSLWLTDRRG